MYLLFLIALIDGVGFGIILPLLPVFALQYNINTFQVGIIAAIFSLFQFISAPLIGMISDKTGRKYVIVLSLAFISYSYHLLSNATTLWIALLSRAIAGCFSGNISVILASITDISSESNRLKNIGIVSAGYGIGFILGPIVGGFLAGDSITNANLEFVFDTASLFTLCAAIFAMFSLKETIKKTSSYFNLITSMRRIITLIIFNQKMMFLIYLSILMWFAFAAINLYVNLWAISIFSLSPSKLGIIISIFGLITVISMVVSQYIIKGGKAILVGFQISAIAMLVLVFTDNLIVVGTVIISLAIGLGILYPNLNSTISSYGTHAQKGFILGLSQSAGMLGQTLGPLVVGFFYSHFYPSYAWFVIFISLFIAYGITLFYMLQNKNEL